MTTDPHELTQERARYWLDRWDRQQEYYIPERRSRFDVIIDVVAESTGRPDPLVVDLGMGPGSLALRLLERIPQARVVGVDADPLLLGLACTAYGDDDRFRVVRTDLRQDGWYDDLALDRAPDAFVSTTALHWMDRGPLQSLMATCAQHLATPGVFVNGDHLYEAEASPRMDALNRAVAQAHSRRLGMHEREDWQTWWQAVEEAPELAVLVTERAGGFDHTTVDRPTVFDWIADLRQAGFAESGTVWQYGDDRVVVGLTQE